MTCIFVTGAFGFLGSTLVPALLAQGHRVLALDDLRYGNGAALAHVMRDPNLEVHVGDCRDIRIVRPLLERADVIIPLAAIVGAPACLRDERGAESINFGAVSMLCKYARPEQLIVYPDSNSLYGASPSNSAIDETAVARPLSHYAQTKYRSEIPVLYRQGVVFRLATAFGVSPRMRTDLLCNDLVLRAYRDHAVTLFEPHFRRNFCHVSDIASAFIYALEGGFKRGEIYNIGNTSANMTKLQLCEIIKERVPEFNIALAEIGTDPDKRDYEVSNAKAEATGWSVRFSLQDGIIELLKLYQTFPSHFYGNA